MGNILLPPGEAGLGDWVPRATDRKVESACAEVLISASAESAGSTQEKSLFVLKRLTFIFAFLNEQLLHLS